MRKIGLTLLTAFVGGAMALGTYKVFEKKEADNMTFEQRQGAYFASNRMPAVTSSAGTEDFTQAAATVTPAVVYIRTTYSSSSQGSDSRRDPFEDLFGEMFGQRSRPQQRTPQRASGSGVIISTDGYIVTNNHVVEKASDIDVTMNDHRHFKAKVIGTDPNTDLALIKITATNLPIVKLGNSDDVRVGEWVLAVGNPFNLTSTVTAGIVSAKGRGLNLIGRSDEEENPFNRTQNAAPRVNRAIESFIQTDAAINPGNSGGALVNTRGELVGINSAIASHTGSYEGYGFAIPINLAKKVLNDIEHFGSVKRGYVGVSFSDLSDPDQAAAVKSDRGSGLFVNDVIAGSGAAQAGIKTGDIITKVEGNTVNESSDLQERVGRLQPGDKISLTYLRGGAEKTVNVTLHADAALANRTAAVSKSAEELYNKLGAGFQPLTPAQKAKFHVNSGVVVTQVRQGGFFDDTEIPVGTVITNINKQPVNSTADIDKAITNLYNGQIILQGYYPDGTRFNSTFDVR